MLKPYLEAVVFRSSILRQYKKKMVSQGSISKQYLDVISLQSGAAEPSRSSSRPSHLFVASACRFRQMNVIARVRGGSSEVHVLILHHLDVVIVH